MIAAIHQRQQLGHQVQVRHGCRKSHYKTSILATCPVVFASLASSVRRGARRPSARATYIASYAERLPRKPHARDKSGPCSCRKSPRAPRSRSACRPRRSVTCRDRFNRRRTWHTSTSIKCGACQACPSLARRAWISAALLPPSRSSTTTEASRTVSADPSLLSTPTRWTHVWQPVAI